MGGGVKFLCIDSVCIEIMTLNMNLFLPREIDGFVMESLNHRSFSIWLGYSVRRLRLG